MTVKELIEELKEMPENCQVFIDTDEFPTIGDVIHDIRGDNEFSPVEAVLLSLNYPKIERD